MKTTMLLDDELVRKARELIGIKEKTALVHAGLRALIAQEAARRPFLAWLRSLCRLATLSHGRARRSSKSTGYSASG
jgi:Arc/MetJ family transcription regulator